MLIKHMPSRNASYQDALEYHLYIHREHPKTGHYEPVLDEHGLLQLRPNCRTFYITADGRDAPVERWAADCLRTNRRFHKNHRTKDIKNHHFILSFPAADRKKLTDEMLEQIARRYVRRYCHGHQALVSIHRDTDNVHIHVTINSVRACQRPAREWMKRKANSEDVLSCEIDAGGKFQDSNELRRDRCDWALAIAKEYGLTLEDNNRQAEINREKRYSCRNQYLRTACEECAKQAHSPEQLRFLLLYRYGVRLIVRGKTVSVQHPAARKTTRLRALGLTADELTRCFSARADERTALLYRFGRTLGVSDEQICQSIALAERANQDHAVMQQYWQAYCEAKDAFWKEFDLDMARLYHKQQRFLAQYWGMPYQKVSAPPPAEVDPLFAALIGGPLLSLLFYLLMQAEAELAWRLQEQELLQAMRAEEELKHSKEMKDLQKEKDALLRMADKASAVDLNLEARMALVEEMQSPLERMWSKVMHKVKYPLLQEAARVDEKSERER